MIDHIQLARNAGFSEHEILDDRFDRFAGLLIDASTTRERKRITDIIRGDRYGIGNMMSMWTNEDVAQDIEEGDQ